MAAVPLRALLALGVLLSVAAGHAATQAPSSPTSRVDRHGDPLPDGAVARLGSSRFRGLCDFLHFSADGKTLVGVEGGCRVRIWDAAGGELLHTRRLGERAPRPSWVVSSACSPDGKTLLIAEGASLQMWDLPSGKRVDVRLPTGLHSLGWLAVSDDRRYLLVADRVKDDLVPQGAGDDLGLLRSEKHLLVWDTTTGKKLLLGNAAGFFMTLAISPDGKRAALASSHNGVWVCDTTSGKVLWREGRLDFEAMTLAFSPDGRLLIAAPAGNEARCRIWDAATGRSPRSMRGPKIGSVATFVVSPDGTKLLASGTDYVLCNLRDGAELQRWPGSNYRGKVAFAPDGRSVVTCDTLLCRWDVATGKALYPNPSRWGHVAPVRRLFFTPDGKRLASVGEDNTLIVWDVPTAGPVHIVPFASTRGDQRWDWSGDGGATNRDGWAMTPDGAVLIGVDSDLVVHRWSVREGRELPASELTEARRADARPGLCGLHVAVAPDGQALALAAWSRNPEHRERRSHFSFWDAETGRLLRWGGDPGKDYQGSHVVMSPDGRSVASGGWLYDTRTGARRQMQPVRDGPPPAGGIVAFSPDGRLLAAIGKTGHVWEAAGGQPVRDVPQAVTTPFTMDSRHAAFTPDGRRFAFASPQHLIVCDLPTGEVLVKRPVPDDLAGAAVWASGGVAFAPDGRTVAVGCRDGTILLWDVPAAPRKRLTEREAAALWDDLARDGSRGWAAVWRFQEDAETAVPFLRKRLPPVPKPQVSWRTLIEQLDSEQFEEREAASRRLRMLGHAAEGPLRQALKEKPAAEQKKRIETLLAVLERSPQLQPDARTLRAVAVLEGLNTPAGRRVLAEWADGLPGAPLSDEAARALARLRWRPAAGN